MIQTSVIGICLNNLLYRWPPILYVLFLAAVYQVAQGYLMLETQVAQGYSRLDQQFTVLKYQLLPCNPANTCQTTYNDCKTS